MSVLFVGFVLVVVLVGVVCRLIEPAVDSFWRKLGLWNEGFLRLALYVAILVTAAGLFDVVLYVVRFGWLSALAWKGMARTVALTVLMLLFAWAAAVVIKQFSPWSDRNVKKRQREKYAGQLKRNG